LRVQCRGETNVLGARRHLVYYRAELLCPACQQSPECHTHAMVSRVSELTASGRLGLIHVEFMQMARCIEYFHCISTAIDESDIAFVRRDRFTRSVKSYLKRRLLRMGHHKTERRRDWHLCAIRRHPGTQRMRRKPLHRFLARRDIDVIPPRGQTFHSPRAGDRWSRRRSEARAFPQLKTTACS